MMKNKIFKLLNLSILNFNLNLKYLLIDLIICSITLIILLGSKVFNLNKDSGNYIILTVWYIVLFIATFFTMMSYSKKTFFEYLNKGKSQANLLSSYTKKDNTVVNLFFIIISSIIKFIIYSCITLIFYNGYKELDLSKMIMINLNVMLNTILVVIAFIFLGLLFNVKYNNSYWIIYGLFILLVILNLISSYSPEIDINDNSESYFKFLHVIYCLPLFGLGSSPWIKLNSWVQYINIPISIIISFVLMYGINVLNRKVIY